MAWIRAAGQPESIKDIFKDGVLEVGMGAYPYKAYNIGAAGSAGGTLSIVNGKLRLYKNGYTGDTSWITDEIDLTNVNSITINVSTFASFTMYAGVTQSGLADNYVMQNTTSISNTGIFTIDTSNIVGSARLAICLYVTNTSTHYMDVDSIVLN